MKLYVLDGGTIDVMDWTLFDPAADTGTERRLAAPCYLVEHASGTLLWDTGLGDVLASCSEGYEIEGVARFSVNRSVVDQLAELGHTPQTIKYLALSHFHPDHAGNANLFVTAELIVQDDEYAAAFGPNAQSFGYDPSLYAALRQARRMQLHGDHDVFGDGTVVVKRYTGHTPGSQSLLLELPDSGRIFISGDLAHSRHNWDHAVVPGLNFDREATLASLYDARGDFDGNGAQIWIQHEYDQWAAARQAPTYYK